MTARATPVEQETQRQAPTPLWRRFPLYGYFAIVVNLTTWYFAWSRIDPFYRYTFFVLWFSFIITLDALVKLRRGSSLMTRAPLKFAQMFLFSTVFWWIFEAFNVPIQNWHYIMDQPYSPLAYNLIATLNFTTVLPAVMELSEFWTSFQALRPRLPADAVGKQVTPAVAARLIVIGVLCAILPFIWPHQTFVLVWLSLAFLLDPLNNLLGRKSALAHLKARDWRFFVAIPLAGLTCGFFWEMWNSQSLPKWRYTVPYVGFGKVFEMPILGYSGYLPFAVELFALYQFLLTITNQRDDALAF